MKKEYTDLRKRLIEDENEVFFTIEGMDVNCPSAIKNGLHLPFIAGEQLILGFDRSSDVIDVYTKYGRFYVGTLNVITSGTNEEIKEVLLMRDISYQCSVIIDESVISLSDNNPSVFDVRGIIEFSESDVLIA